MVAVPSKGRADAGIQHLAPEAAATRELYERYARQIFSFCLSQLRNREEAEDATQSTFLNAFRGLQRGIEPEYESAWLFKIAQNVCLTRQRSTYRRRRVETPGDLDAVQDELPSPPRDTDELIGLPQALEGMPDQQRRALLLREWQGLSYKEIAEELGLSQSAVETLLFRARRSLAQGLTEEPKHRKGLARRLRAGGDAGSVLAVVKTLFFSGGAKVAATLAAVAAASVVASTPSVRHTVEAAVAPPRAHKAAPVQSAPAPIAVPPAHLSAPPVAVPHLQAAAPAAPAKAHRVKQAPRYAPAARHDRAAAAQAAPARDSYDAPAQPAAVKQASKAVAHGHTATAKGSAQHQTKAKTVAPTKPARHQAVHAKAKPSHSKNTHAQVAAKPAASANNGNGSGPSAAHGNAKKN